MRTKDEHRADVDLVFTCIYEADGVTPHKYLCNLCKFVLFTDSIVESKLTLI